MNINDLLNIRNKNLTISENLKINTEGYRHIQSQEFINNISTIFLTNQVPYISSYDIDYYQYMSTISSDPVLPIYYDIASHLCFLFMAAEIYDRRSSKMYRYIHNNEFSGYFIKVNFSYLFIGFNEEKDMYYLSKVPKNILRRTFIEVLKKVPPVNIIEFPIVLNNVK